MSCTGVCKDCKSRHLAPAVNLELLYTLQLQGRCVSCLPSLACACLKRAGLLMCQASAPALCRVAHVLTLCAHKEADCELTPSLKDACFIAAR